MNFYIDFEATQKSAEIISIGCVADNGNTFNTYVKPSNLNDITPFIQKLTGITPALIQEKGIDADTAFFKLKNFILFNTGEEEALFYCYGNTDKTFIQHTACNSMKDFDAKIFAGYLAANLIDYAKIAVTYITSKSISLKKLLMLVRHDEEVVQHHDALDDAKMLKECHDGIDNISLDAMPEAVSNLPQISAKDIDLSRSLTGEEKEYLKKIRTLWASIGRSEITGDCTKEEAKVIITNIHSGEEKYFSSYYVAATYFNLKHLKNVSSTKIAAIHKTIKSMAKQPNNFCSYRCEIL